MSENVGELVLKRRAAKKLFGIEKGDTTELIVQIKRIYRQLAIQHHPDRNPINPEEATRTMARINEAYEILSIPESGGEKHIRRFYEDFII